MNFSHHGMILRCKFCGVIIPVRVGVGVARLGCLAGLASRAAQGLAKLMLAKA
jgi:hypothetical protein